MSGTADTNNFVELFLTCKDQAEADKVAQSLLEKHLVACVKFEPVRSRFWWQGRLEESDEVRVSMLSLKSNFAWVESEVAKSHSYDTFVLQAMPVLQLNEAAAAWVTEYADKVK